MTAEHQSGFEVVTELDCVGMYCPMPIYKAHVALRKMSSGQVLKVLCSDPGSLRDFPAFTRQANHDLLATEKAGKAHVFFIRKGGS